MNDGIKFYELVSKITWNSETKESILHSILNWTKNNNGVQLIQKIRRKNK